MRARVRAREGPERREVCVCVCGAEATVMQLCAGACSAQARGGEREADSMLCASACVCVLASKGGLLTNGG